MLILPTGRSKANSLMYSETMENMKSVNVKCHKETKAQSECIHLHPE